MNRNKLELSNTIIQIPATAKLKTKTNQARRKPKGSSPISNRAKRSAFSWTSALFFFLQLLKHAKYKFLKLRRRRCY